MKISLSRILFLGAGLMFLIGYMADITRVMYVDSTISFQQNIPELTLARYYAKTGQFESAVEEYKSLRESDDLQIKTLATQELNNLITLKSNGWLFFRKIYLPNMLWVLPQNSYIISFVLTIIWLMLLVIRLSWRRPELSIQPIVDRSGKDLGDEISDLVISRLRSIIYNSDKLVNNPMIIPETLEAPILNLVTENNLTDMVKILESSLTLPIESIKYFPLSYIVDAMRSWLVQPKYLLRSYLGNLNNSLVLMLSLEETKDKTIVKEWKIIIESDDGSDMIQNVVDSLVFPVILYFGKESGTRRWESIRELQRGLDEFIAYEETGFQTSHLQKAIEHIENSLTFDQDYSLSRCNLAFLYLQIGEYEKAKDYFTIDLDKHVTLEIEQYSLYGYSVALLYTNQFWALERAAVILKKLIGDSTNSELSCLSTSTLALVYSKLFEIDNKNQLYMNLALSEAQVAKQCCANNKSIIANALAAEGYSFLASGSLENARTSFQDAINADPKNFACVIGLGLSFISFGEKEKAIIAFKRAEKLSPSNGYINYKIGNIYKEMGEKENAIAAYERAEGFSLSHLMLGKYFLDEKRYIEALIEFRKAVLYNRKLSDGWQNITWTICELETSDNELLQEAEDSAHRAVALEKIDGQIWHRYAVLSRILLLRGKAQAALQAAEKAVSLAPQRAQAHCYLAQVQYISGFFDASQAHAQIAIELDKNGGEWQAKSKELIHKIHMERK